MKSFRLTLSNSSAASVHAMSPIALPTARVASSLAKRKRSANPYTISTQAKYWANRKRVLVRANSCRGSLPRYAKKLSFPVRAHLRPLGAELDTCRVVRGRPCGARVVFSRVQRIFPRASARLTKAVIKSGDDGDGHGTSRRVADLLVKQESLTGPKRATSVRTRPAALASFGPRCRRQTADLRSHPPP